MAVLSHLYRANLATGIEPIVQFDVELQLEVLVGFVRGHEGIALLGDGGAHDHSVDHFVFMFAPDLVPTFEGFFVE